MDTTQKSPAILSLCTGLLRGLERGIESALQTELRTIAYVEIETFVVDNLLQGMEKGILGAAPIWTNLKTFPYRQFHGKIFGITGGYPCQPFSVAGNRRGNKDPRHLWPYIRRITESTKPVFCFFENVEGHLNLGFEEVSRDLRKMGYRVEAGIYSAEECGAPHQRKRLFILAVRPEGISQLKQFLANSNRNGSSIHGSSSTTREDGPERWEKGSETFRSSGASSQTGGLSENEGGDWFEWDEEFENSPEVGYTNNRRSPREERIDERIEHGEERPGLRDSTLSASEKLANSRLLGSSINEEQTTRSEQYGQDMADPSGNNAQRIITERIDTEGRTVERKRPIRSQSVFPSRPGEFQFDWEHPRVAKSGMGITVDGYNFREDLLRGAGNGVVWQSAARAFTDLLNKFQDE